MEILAVLFPGLLLLTIKSANGLDCFKCTHTAVEATDRIIDAALQKTLNYDGNQVSCLLGTDTFEENVPDVVTCDWNVLNRKVLLSVAAQELVVDEDKTPLEVAYPGNRQEEYEFRCEKQRVDITWNFDGFDIRVDVHTRGCQAVHIAHQVPNTCTYDMESWLGDKYQKVQQETNAPYSLAGELCFCDTSHCNHGNGLQMSAAMLLVLLLVFGLA